MKASDKPGMEILKEYRTHPLYAGILKLRQIILYSGSGITENIKWNSPNFCDGIDDRITMRIAPTAKLQLIFHRGAKKMEQPQHRIIHDGSGLLEWKEHDRAVMTFYSLDDIEKNEGAIKDIVVKWIDATRS